MTTSLPSVPGELTRPVDAARDTWSNVFSLLHTLGSAHSVRDVARLSLLTVMGQLLFTRSALFLASEEDSDLDLCQVLGFRASRLGLRRLRRPSNLEFHVEQIDDDSQLPASIKAQFNISAVLTDGESMVGVLFLGGRLAGREFEDTDGRLLEAMGLAIGSAMQKALAFDQVARAKERLEDTERVRQSIIDHVSHEFNTPLMVVKETGDLMESADEEMRAELRQMHREAVERLQQMVKAIMMVSQRRHSIDLEEISQIEFETGVLGPIVHRFETANVPCFESTEVVVGIALRIHSTEFQAALDAVLLNASSFGRAEHPWVAVQSYAVSRQWWNSQSHIDRLPLYRQALSNTKTPRLSRILFGESPPPPPADQMEDLIVVVEVLDSGIGIPEDERELVFEPFRQASNSPTRGVKGAGMGLTGARQLLRDMGGDIKIRSRLGQGTIIGIQLPALWREPFSCLPGTDPS